MTQKNIESNHKYLMSLLWSLVRRFFCLAFIFFVLEVLMASHTAVPARNGLMFPANSPERSTLLNVLHPGRHIDRAPDQQPPAVPPCHT